MATKAARPLLPDRVPHVDAAANSARAALLVHAIAGRTDLLWESTRDWLHQEYRRPAMPRSHELMTELRGAGLAAVISGAGPTVLVLGDADRTGRRRRRGLGAGRPGIRRAVWGHRRRRSGGVDRAGIDHVERWLSRSEAHRTRAVFICLALVLAFLTAER